ncbi:hypothetical protein WN943_025059 [Citrus x changshan-huyou]
MFSSSSIQSKELISEPNIRYNLLIANDKPGQIRRPAPKGISSKFWPLKSTSDPKNLSGIKEQGLSHILSSLPIAHTLTKACAPFGTTKPAISMSSETLRGTNKGTVGSSAIAHSIVIEAVSFPAISKSCI